VYPFHVGSRLQVVCVLALFAAVGSVAVAPACPASSARFRLPYDLAVARTGTIYFPDRSRVLSLDARGRVRVHARVAGARELVGLARLDDGTLFVTDLPSGRVLRVRPGGGATSVASIAQPVDLIADATGTTLLVASIADGVGVVRVDVRSGSVATFAAVERPHGLARLPGGDLVVHDGHVVSRVDGATGAVSRLADVDAVKLVAARDGSVYGAVGTPAGGRVVRIDPEGRVTTVAGTGRLGEHRDGIALRAHMLPSAVALDRRGRLLVAQLEPTPAIRRVDLATGRIVTLARGR
jgi:sugar lactone lactonase YvrE